MPIFAFLASNDAFLYVPVARGMDTFWWDDCLCIKVEASVKQETKLRTHTHVCAWQESRVFLREV